MRPDEKQPGAVTSVARARNNEWYDECESHEDVWYGSEDPDPPGVIGCRARGQTEIRCEVRVGQEGQSLVEILVYERKRGNGNIGQGKLRSVLFCEFIVGG